MSVRRRFLSDPPLLLTSVLLVAVPGGRSTPVSAQATSVALDTGLTSVAYLGPTLPVLDALTNVSDVVTAVWFFDGFAAAGTSPWRTWNPALPDALQGLSALESGEAYFLVSDTAAEWEFAGVVEAPASVELAAGGNLVGYYGATLPVEEALGLVVAQVGEPGPATSIDAIFEFVDGLWHAWRPPPAPAFTNQLTTLVFGRPYFVATSEAFEWVFEGGGASSAPDPDRVAAVLGGVLTQAQIDDLLTNFQDVGSQTFLDRLPALDGPALRINGAAVLEVTLEAISVAELRASQVVEFPVPLDAGDDYVVVLGGLDGPPDLGGPVEFQFGVGVSRADLPNTQPDPDGLGLGWAGRNRDFFVDDPSGGWQEANSIGGRLRSTDAIGFAGPEDPFFVFLIPVDETGRVDYRLLHLLTFGRLTDGQPANDVQPATTVLSTVLEDPDGFTSNFRVPPTPNGGGCTVPVPGSSGSPGGTLCLNNDRFKVEVDWTTFSGTPGYGGHAAALRRLGHILFPGLGGRFGVPAESAERMRLQRPLLVFPRRADECGVHADRDRHGDFAGEELRQPARHAVRADPGHASVRDVSLARGRRPVGVER